MAKVVSRRNKKRRQGRNVNWMMIGGIFIVGVIALFALLFTTLQGQGAPTATPESVTAISDYCAANENNCFEKGEEDAPVTIVEISDYACSHCRNFNLGGTAEALEEQYVDNGQVRWIVVPYSSNETTQDAAEAAFCAAEQDLFFEYHEAMFNLFGTNGAYSREGILTAADNAGADVAAFGACVDAGEYEDDLQRNLVTVVNSGVRVTPTFFINGRMVEGNMPLDSFQQQIDQFLES